MYLHIGWGYVVHIEDIIAIVRYNVDKKNKGPVHYFKAKEIIKVHEEEEPKTYVVTKDKVYVTSLSVLTLAKRIKKNDLFSK